MSELRGPEFVRGYAAAMKYASEFVRDAGKLTPIGKAFGIVADHFDEKVEMVKAAAASDAKIAELVAALNPPTPSKETTE